MLQAASALAITLGLLLLALHALRRLQRVSASSGALPLGVVQRLTTGKGQGVTLVRCGTRVLVLAESAGRLELLTELGGADLAQVLGGDAGTPAPAGAPVPEAVRRALRLAPLALLLALPAAARAQQADSAARPAAQVPAPAPARPAAAVPAGTAPLPLPPAVTQAPQPTGVRIGPPVGLPRATAATRGGGLSVEAPAAPGIELTIGGPKDGLKLSGAVGLVLFMGAMTLLPALFLLTTSFTRILIVLHFLRSALGTQTSPPGQLLVAISVLLTGVVMHPTLEAANARALQPYLAGQLTQVEAYQAAVAPLREFMLANTREQDLATFTELAGVRDAKTVDDVPTMTVISAFVTSELRTAFQMGFVIFLPFVIVDLVVASVLMSMGMFMLPPVMVALPFKLLLFVLADGWSLVVRSLVASFH